MLELENHLRELGLKEGQDLIVHSALMNFGVIEGGVKTVYHAIRNVVGDQATIAVPTYLVGTKPELIFDPKVTPSHACGVFSEYIRNKKGAMRSLCPLHNHSAIGSKAQLLRTVDGSVSMGPGSDFWVLHEAGFGSLLLGCPFSDGATFSIHLEAVVQVPFRKWIDLKRTIVLEDGSHKVIRCKYYVRKSDEFVEDLSPIKRNLEELGIIREAHLRKASSLFIPTEGYTATLDLFVSNPTVTLV